MKRGLTVVLAALVLLTGCDPQTGTDAGNGSGTGNNTPSGGGNGATGTAAAELLSMDIADAESIYISTPTEAGETVSAKAGVTARTISERAAARGFTGSVLFKITKEGKAVEISLTWGNDKNENTAQLRPVAVYEAGPDYVITEFYNPTIRQNIGYLINKKTGKAYSLEEVGVPQRFGDPVTFRPLIYLDGTENIYYKTKLPYAQNGKNYDIVKINVSHLEVVSTELKTLPQEYLENLLDTYWSTNSGFVVDKDGNIIYDKSNGTSMPEAGRVLFSSGGISSVTQISQDMWVGLDGNIYGTINEESGSSYMCKYRFDTQLRKVVAEKVDTGIVPPGFCDYSLKVGNELLHIDRTGYTVVYNENMKLCRSKSFSEFEIEIVALTASDTCYYISGRDKADSFKDKVIRIDPRGEGSYTVVSDLSDYVVYQLAYTDRFLTFGAVKLSNGNSVIGKINPDGGKPEIISETTNGNITYLTPIN